MATSAATLPRQTSSRWFAAGIADSLLRPLTRVDPGEGKGAALLALNLFLILAAYYLLKTVRETLILTQGGAEVKAYSSAGQALLLLGFVPFYSWLAGRLDRFRLSAALTLFFSANLLIFALLSRLGVGIGVGFYLWLGVFSLATVAQFWAFANDLYTEEQGKRLFPVVGLGSSIGALAGSRLAAWFAAWPPESVMLLAAGILSGGLAITWAINRQACSVCAEQRTNARETLAGHGALALVFQNRYFLLIGVMVLLVNIANTGGEFLLSKLVVSEAEQAAVTGGLEAKRAFIGKFYGDYFGWIGLAGLLFQALLVSRLFQWVGVRGSLFLLPTIALGGYAVLVIAPLLGVAFTAKVFENATDYSVQNTARQALFLGVSREAKYKAKTAIDTLFYRAGDLAQAGIVWAGTQMAFGTRQFALVNVGVIVVLIAVVTALFRMESPEG